MGFSGQMLKLFNFAVCDPMTLVFFSFSPGYKRFVNVMCNMSPDERKVTINLVFVIIILHKYVFTIELFCGY